MIIKNADSKDAAIATLQTLSERADARQQKFITEELRMMRSGIKGEQESAYHIDFQLNKSLATAVIHDLRLEIGGRVAQIDHLLIHRTHRFYVLETKNFSHGLKINEHGEFLRWNNWNKSYEGMPSPIEQNKRHVVVLSEILERLGYKNPVIESFILISPNARIERPSGNAFPEVVKADQFLTALEKNISSGISSVGGFLGAVSKLTFGDPPEAIAQKLVRLHRPIQIDYAGKFGMPENIRPPSASAPTADSQASFTRLTVEVHGAAKQETATSVSAPPSNESTGHACRSCSSSELSVEYGKYGYYFKCSACGGNTPLKIDCGVAGHKEKIRKDKLMFYRECAQCGSSSEFFTNKA